MKQQLRKNLALLLSLAMLFTFFPTAASAAGDEVYKQITSQEELTDGSYVMVVDSGYAMGALDSGWLTATELAASDSAITGPDANLVWDIAVTEDGVTLTDSNGIQVAPKGGDSNGIKAGNYTWAISFENGAFRFMGTGNDTVTLACNEQYESKFRAYKNDTASKYPRDFTLYKLEGEGGTTEPGPDEPETISIKDALAAADGLRT